MNEMNHVVGTMVSGLGRLHEGKGKIINMRSTLIVWGLGLVLTETTLLQKECHPFLSLLLILEALTS